MTGTYNPWLVSLSVIVAILVSYTALNLAVRVSNANRSSARLWLGGGAVAMGGGIWSMHFIGMLAFSLPIPLAYDVARTIGSLVIAILTSGFALWIAARSKIGLTALAASAVVMGLGICAMHYSGMSAIQILPMITYESRAVPRLDRYRHRRVLRSVVALRSTSHGQHAASGSDDGRLCDRHGVRHLRDALHRDGGIEVRGGVLLPDRHGRQQRLAREHHRPGRLRALILTLVLLFYDAHLTRSRAHATQLQRANEQLHHLATHDALTGLPNRVLLADRLEQASAHAERDGGSLRRAAGGSRPLQIDK